MPSIIPVRRVLLKAPAVIIAPGGSDPFALDGTPVTANSGSTNSLVLPAFSTSFGNDIIYVAVVANGIPTGVSGGGLTWTQRVINSNIAFYTAPASSALTNAVFTCTASSADYTTALAFAFSGSHFASPYDPNAAIPDTGAGGDFSRFTTSNADDILITAGVTNLDIDAGLGFTDTPTAFVTAKSNFLSVGYKLVSATQTNFDVLWGGSNKTSVQDAIIKGP